LWSAGRVFDALVNRAEWDLFVYYDGLNKKYRRRARRARGRSDHVGGQFATFAEMVQESERAMRRADPRGEAEEPPVLHRRAGRGEPRAE
jgi:hypothetical protein